MDTAEISKMLGVLEYHSVGPNKADSGVRDGAAEALKQYHATDGDGKRKFLRGRRSKNLNRFRSFTPHKKTISDQKATAVREGRLNGSQILATAARLTVISELTEQSEAEFGYKGKIATQTRRYQTKRGKTKPDKKRLGQSREYQPKKDQRRPVTRTPENIRQNNT